jgi:hypothetical protein
VSDQRESLPAASALLDIWTQRLDPPVDPDDIVGFTVEAMDAGIGKVEAAIESKGVGRLIVDTESSTSTGRHLLPFGIIDHVAFETETVFLDRSTREIESAPAFDPEVHRRDARYYELVGDHYSR